MQQAMRDRAPKVQRPGRVGSKFLLSGLLKCGVCGRPYSGQGAKSGQYGYYICGTLFREGAGTCTARYLNAPRVEDFVVEKIRERILTEETIVELVALVAEEIDRARKAPIWLATPTLDLTSGCAWCEVCSRQMVGAGSFPLPRQRRFRTAAREDPGSLAPVDTAAPARQAPHQMAHGSNAQSRCQSEPVRCRAT